MTAFHAISCSVDSKVLVEHLPLTLMPLPDAPLSEVRLTLDLSGSPDSTEIAELLEVLMGQHALTTWILVEQTSKHGWRLHGYITHHEPPQTAGGRTTMALNMHLAPIGDHDTQRT